MKKKLCVLSILTVSLLTGCGNGVSQNDYDKAIKERDEYKEKYETLLKSLPDTETKTNIIENEESSIDELSDLIEEIHQYTWESNNYSYAGIELKNNSDSLIRLNSEFIFYDEDNNIIGSKKESYLAFETASNILLYAANDAPFHHFEYILNPSVDTFNHPVYSKLKSEVNETDKKLIYSITNTGDTEAEFVKCTVLFLRNGKAAAHSYAYAGTSNGKIAPSATEHAEIRKPYNIPYDDYILFLDGQ